MNQNVDNLLLFLLRKEGLEKEAEAEGSNIQCPKCQTYLPSRSPFFGWDNENGKPSYYCTLCEYDF